MLSFGKSRVAKNDENRNSKGRWSAIEIHWCNTERRRGVEGGRITRRREIDSSWPYYIYVINRHILEPTDSL